MQVRAYFVRFTTANGVTLGTACLEKISSLAGVTYIMTVNLDHDVQGILPTWCVGHLVLVAC